MLVLRNLYFRSEIRNIGFLILLLFFSVLASASAAQERWALVISVADYSDPGIPDLDNTVNDGRTMASVFNQMGFEVYFAENYDKDSIESVIEQVKAEQENSSLGVLFFAGHGVQVGGENYALPSDIRLDDRDDLNDNAISIGKTISELAQTKVDNLVVILDACRNSPFSDSATGTGLAFVDAPANTLIAYSTAPGELALDGVGTNSPYTAALARALEGERADVRDALRLVRARVRLATQGRQTPWFVDNSKGPMEIFPKSGPAKSYDLPPLKAQEISLAATAWWTIAQSADRRDFENYLELFPDAPQAESARRQLTLVGNAPDFPLMEVKARTANPEVPGGLNSFITACDILATPANGNLALVAAVPHDQINVRIATRACIEAVKNEPNNPRLVGLLAWTMYLSERFAEALYYNERAAELGNPSAYGAMSGIYRFGLGVPVDIEKSAEMALKAALGGSQEMRVVMGMHYREGWGVSQSFKEAERWFELAVLDGATSAMSALGDLYRRGKLGVPQPEKAVELYRKAATLGQPDAMNNLGMAYMRGDGVEKNTDIGISWLSEASELGNPYAAWHLGRAFLDGWGVEKDPKRAVAFFRLSAQRNFLTAYIYLGDALQAMDEPNLPEAMANYIIAREAGILKDTEKSRLEAQEAAEKIMKIREMMSEAQIIEGTQTADNWISEYGLLDFTLVHQ